MSAPLGPQAYRGESIGLPEHGTGSVAPGGRRVTAFIVDAVASGIIAALFVPHAFGSTGTAADHLPQLWVYVPFALDYVIGVLIAGRTLGMYLTGLRLIRVTPNVSVGPARIVLRTALLCLFVPAVVFDRDGRGLHDRFSDTAVVNA